MNIKEECDDLNLNIVVLRPKTRELLSSMLNPTKKFKTDEGVCRDWHGLVALCCIPGESIPSIDHDPDPTRKTLKVWYNLAKETATVANLLNYLEEMDRTDVVDDSVPLIKDDIKCYKEKKPIPKDVDDKLGLDKNVLTFDDIARVSKGMGPQYYDAFVLFADEDINFATTVIKTMEQEYDLKLFVKYRDLIVCEVEHDALIKMITQRCRALIIILSNEFLESETLTFFYRLAQSISLKKESGETPIKVLPCLYKKCDNIPAELMCYHKLHYGHHGLCNFFDLLHKSITGSENTRNRPRTSDSLANVNHSVAIRGSSATTPRLSAISEPIILPPRSSDSRRNVSIKIEPSTSADNLGSDKEPTNGKKRSSVFQKVKSLVSKPKLKSNDENDKKKKSIFTLRRNKKKAVLASN